MTYSLVDANNDYTNKLHQIDLNLPSYKANAKQIIEDCSKIDMYSMKDQVEYNLASSNQMKDEFIAAIDQQNTLKGIQTMDVVTYNIQHLPKVCSDAFNALFKDAGLCDLEGLDCPVNPFSAQYTTI